MPEESPLKPVTRDNHKSIGQRVFTGGVSSSLQRNWPPGKTLRCESCVARASELEQLETPHWIYPYQKSRWPGGGAQPAILAGRRADETLLQIAYQCSVTRGGSKSSSGVSLKSGIRQRWHLLVGVRPRMTKHDEGRIVPLMCSICTPPLKKPRYGRSKLTSFLAKKKWSVNSGQP